jgi:hypothetical protein
MVSRGSGVVGGLVLLGWSGFAGAAGFVEDFASDPVATGRWTVHDGDGSRFAYNAAADTLTAAYDTGLPTARLVRDVGITLTDETAFSFEVDFEILSAGFFADPDGFAQIACGLMNSVTTGTDRAGGGPNGGDAYDVASLDYFPNVSPVFGGPTLGPTIVNSETEAGFFSAINFAFGQETGLDDPGEAPLPLDTALTASLEYSPLSRVCVIRLTDAGGGLPVNLVGALGAAGGADGDTATIELVLPAGKEFAVDRFGLLLWQDTFAIGSSVIADVVYRRVVVEVGAAPSDFDLDGDVDLTDYGVFLGCYNGPGHPVGSECQLADLDGDGDVDLEDYGEFLACYNGPASPPACE